jgi:NAD(P)-dependent dehydrogenase (short-subunit alcohol dehydrogenase family)
VSAALPLAGRVALVAGAAGPYGRAIAVALAEAGAELVLTTGSRAPAEEFAINSIGNELWALDRRYLALVTDLADADSVRQALKRVLTELGRLDYIVGDTTYASAVLSCTAEAGGSRGLTAVILADDEPDVATLGGLQQGFAVRLLAVDAATDAQAIATNVLHLIQTESSPGR